MKSRCPRPSLFFALLLPCLALPCPLVRAESAPLTKYDLMTNQDMFLSRYLNPDPHLDRVSKWPIVKDVAAIGGDLIDAHQITAELNQGLPVDEQPAFRHVKRIVNECAEKLGVHPPKLFVRQDSEVTAYVTCMREPHLLVLSSSFYELYKDRREEMRFMIGHELGHLKCNHLRAHTVGRALMSFISGPRSTSRIRESFVANRIVGQLLSWFREAEFSADRAGLVCVNGNLEIAKSALLRLKHGTREDVIPKIAEQEVLDYLNEPFVKMVRKLRARGSSPYVFDRCLELEKWTKSRAYEQLVRRKQIPEQQWLVIYEIEIANLPNADYAWGEGKACDPMIKAVIGDQEFEADAQTDNNHPTVSKIAWKAPYYPNTPIFVEVRDHDNRTADDFIGGAMIPLDRITYPSGEKQTIGLRRDIKKRCNEANLPQVTVKYYLAGP